MCVYVCVRSRVDVCARLIVHAFRSDSYWGPHTHACIHTQVWKGYGNEILAAILKEREGKSRRRKQEEALNRERRLWNIHTWKMKTCHSYFSRRLKGTFCLWLCCTTKNRTALDLTREEFYCSAQANGKIPGRGHINNWTNDSSYQYWRADRPEEAVAGKQRSASRHFESVHHDSGAATNDYSYFQLFYWFFLPLLFWCFLSYCIKED